jgi:hypothetical protein
MTQAANENQKYEPTAQQKKLLRLVYIMGVVFALLFLGLIGGLIWKAMKPKAPPPVVQAVQDLGIVPSDVRLMELDGDRLALTTSKELVVIDLKSKTVIMRLAQ